jgi:hypothetical protein
MTYRLYSVEMQSSGPYGGPQKVAVEVRPPLRESAHAGILKELTERVGEDPKGPAAQMANITRHDDDGTLIVLTRPNHELGLEQHEHAARFIGKLIDPCGVVGVEYPNQAP